MGDIGATRMSANGQCPNVRKWRVRERPSEGMLSRSDRTVASAYVSPPKIGGCEAVVGAKAAREMRMIGEPAGGCDLGHGGALRPEQISRQRKPSPKDELMRGDARHGCECPRKMPNAQTRDVCEIGHADIVANVRLDKIVDTPELKLSQSANHYWLSADESCSEGRGDRDRCVAGGKRSLSAKIQLLHSESDAA